MNAAIPPMPHATVDTRLDAPQALMLAEEAIAHQVPLMSNFNMTKIYGEVTGRHPTGFTYRTTTGPSWKIRMNDGYVVGQDNGQGGTRVSFHESKRSTIIYGIILAAVVAIELLLFFTAVSSTPAPTYYGQGGGMVQIQPPASSGMSPWFFWPFAIFAVGVTAFQFYEVVTAPKKAVQYFSMRANGGMPAQQPGYPAQVGGFPGQPGGFPGQPGGFPPQQQPGGFPPQMQPQGFPPQPQQAGFPSAGPAAGFPPQAQPAPFPQPDPVAVPQAAAPAAPSPEDKLRQLAELRDAGVITAADYDQAAAAIQAKG